MKATIITIGDEILIGQIIDTNSAWISQKLNEVGIIVKEIRSIGDNKEQIINTIAEMLNVSDLVLVTGGLGPTNDDITKNVLCDFFESKLILSESVLENINELLSKRGFKMNAKNQAQAMVPNNAKILNNKMGTAPGMLFEKNGKYLISMPGVPFEMKHLMETQVLPFIKDKFTNKPIIHKTLMVVGLPESMLAEKIADWENALPKFVHLAYLPSPGFIRLRLSIYEAELEHNNLIGELTTSLIKIIPDNIFAEIDVKPEVLIGQLLIAQEKTLSTAESCTGGTIASMITSIPGSSSYFKGSVVSYDNEVKQNILQVKQNDLLQFGAVSQQVVEQMAKGVLNLLKTDYAIAVSGIAGPDGGTPEKPVGTIWIAVASKEKILCKLFHSLNNREINILRAANTALAMMIEMIKNQHH
ncbi:MAG: competence/damage-inducible protein A, partial [Bacteroidales bacterium]|nr:competence/damage-inducible protein A [Bacteroidales bacterium]